MVEVATRALKRALILSPVLVAAAMTAGCMSSPTYGTDKTANEQLMDDLSGMVSLGTGQRKEPIDYKPRPELVKPASTASLPVPQESVASTENANWPESPEQRRARIRAEATENASNPNWRPTEVIADAGPNVARASVQVHAREAERPQNGTEPGARIQRDEFNRRLVEQRQGNPTQRKYLSEPPLAYRAPAPTATVGDIGEDEAVKERRAKAEARKASGKNGVARWVPWL